MADKTPSEEGFDYEAWIDAGDTMIGKRVEVHAHLDTWMRGDRFATVESCEGSQGTSLLYRLKFNSGTVKVMSDANFRLIPGLIQ